MCCTLIFYMLLHCDVGSPCTSSMKHCFASKLCCVFSQTSVFEPDYAIFIISDLMDLNCNLRHSHSSEPLKHFPSLMTCNFLALFPNSCLLVISKLHHDCSFIVLFPKGGLLGISNVQTDYSFLALLPLL